MKGSFVYKQLQLNVLSLYSSIDTSRRLGTMTLEKVPAKLPGGINIENKVFLLQRLVDSRGSLQTSRTTLKDFGESKL